jgi:hypothetical protein
MVFQREHANDIGLSDIWTREGVAEVQFIGVESAKAAANLSGMQSTRGFASC